MREKIITDDGTNTGIEAGRETADRILDFGRAVIIRRRVDDVTALRDGGGDAGNIGGINVRPRDERQLPRRRFCFVSSEPISAEQESERCERVIFELG